MHDIELIETLPENMETAKEVLIVQNTCVSYLYDVIIADFGKEVVDYVDTMLTFEEAQGLMIEIEENLTNK